MALSKDDIAQIAALIAAANAQPKAATPSTAKPTFDPAAKDAAIAAWFRRKGFKDVVLLNRADPSQPFTVKAFKMWLAEGRVVRKGQHGYKGLFHRDQTDVLPAKPTPPKSRKAKLHAVPTQPAA
jgi:hypothetical protein